MNFNPKGVVQLVSWMESLSCCAFLFLLLFIYLLPSRPQYPMAHPILHTIFLIRYVKALEEVFFPDRTCCPKDIGEKKKKKTFSLFLSGDIAPLYTKKAGRDCFLLSRLCCSEWAKVLSLHLNTFIRKLWLVWDEVRENKNQKSCRTANRWGGKWQFGLLKRRMWWWIWDRYTFLQKRKEKVCTLKEAYH